MFYHLQLGRKERSPRFQPPSRQLQRASGSPLSSCSPGHAGATPAPSPALEAPLILGRGAEGDINPCSTGPAGVCANPRRGACGEGGGGKGVSPARGGGGGAGRTMRCGARALALLCALSLCLCPAGLELPEPGSGLHAGRNAPGRGGVTLSPPPCMRSVGAWRRSRCWARRSPLGCTVRPLCSPAGTGAPAAGAMRGAVAVPRGGHLGALAAGQPRLFCVQKGSPPHPQRHPHGSVWRC